MPYKDTGTLVAKAYTAGEALPVKNTTVRISGADEENRFVQFTLLTDVDGLTPRVTLPTPEKSYSLAPSPAEIPYAQYNLEISADGYYPKKMTNVAIFSGTDTFIPINMVPISVYKNGVDFPKDTLDTTVTENPYL